MARVVILGPEYPAHPSIATRASSSFRRSPRRSCRTAMRQAPRVRSRCATRARKRSGEVEQLRYDYFINATGPKLRFDAVHAAAELDKVIATLKTGVRQTLVVGMGHGMCPCEGGQAGCGASSGDVTPWSGVRGVVGYRSASRIGRHNDDVSRRPELSEVSRHGRPKHQGDARPDRVVGALAQAHAERTLRRRQNLAVQAVKFIGSSLNIMMMVIKGHDKP